MNKIVRILPGIFLSLLSLSSCDGLFTEDCIYKGYLHARNGFRHPSDMGTPEQAEMNLMVFPLTGNGVAEYDNLSIPFNGSGDAYGTLHIGSYEFLACNKDVNILEDAGSAATVRLRVPTEQGKITAEQGYAYSSSVTGTVMTDDTLHVTCESKLMVQRIVFNITVTNTGILEYTGITAELDGVTTSRYVRTREKGSDFATLPFTVSPEKENFFRKEVLVFGINTGVSNIIRLHLDGDMPVDADLDLSDVFKDFTADGISVDITVRVSPSLHTATASIEDWQNVEWGQGTVTY